MKWVFYKKGKIITCKNLKTAKMIIHIHFIIKYNIPKYLIAFNPKVIRLDIPNNQIYKPQYDILTTIEKTILYYKVVLPYRYTEYDCYLLPAQQALEIIKKHTI